jgi:hypothetical protein
MSQQVDCYGRNQKDPRGNQWAKIAPSFGRKGLSARLRFESLEIDSGAIGSGTAIRSWRVCRPDTSIKFNSQSRDLCGMNVSGSMATWCGGRPSAHDEILGSDGKRPTSINIGDIGPANGDLLRGIGNDDSATLESDLGLNQKDVDTGSHERCHQSTRYFASSATLIEARPEKKTTHDKTNPGKHQVGFWAVGLRLNHLLILSHMSSNSMKAVG